MLDLPAGAVIVAAPDDPVYVDELDLGVVAASRVAYNLGTLLYGYAICEATGAATAKIRIRDGRDVGGSVVAPISLAIGGTLVMPPGDYGVRCTAGIFLEVVSGSVEVSLYLSRLRV